MNERVKVSYELSKCVVEEFNGTHEEVFDLSKLTDEDKEAYLIQALTIKRQAMIRAQKDAGKITIGTWEVPPPNVRATTVESKADKVKAMLAKLTPEQRKAFMEMISSEEEV